MELSRFQKNVITILAWAFGVIMIGLFVSFLYELSYRYGNAVIYSILFILVGVSFTVKMFE